MANVSPDLLWPIVRDTSCFLKKAKASQRSRMGKKGVTLTTEPNNLTGINSYKHSGLANAKTISITPADNGIVLTTKSRKPDRIAKPNKTYNKVTLTRDFRRVANTIVKETSDNFYRADLQKAALAKWSLIYKSLKRASKSS
mmetsp:Transcript_54919/g.91049  ORF Transcript_54919/g.91049 Transcript_54919/m.91049 type:complete len:142 (+) Transcript_54919:50-475(+)|eukprot:CAMPEP_0119309336 /NCGR_PEP_ID=MMETSP1333-20130426/15032_1 /TAXON_ID=418940 /ORGANISM="Scyphosphaera apsteinii, Strain RCC1455" /LENGTH=141 /DNA_ID=CAMNT_0007313291 /DNA_START=46 /DNA_END=471 /DNA_ORIENTATION=-